MPDCRRSLQAVTLTLCLALPSLAALAVDAERPGRLAETLELRLERIQDSDVPSVAGAALAQPKRVVRLYEELDGIPAWVNHRGLTEQGLELLEILQATPFEGLNPNSYHVTPVAGMLQRMDNEAAAARAEAEAMRLARAREMLAEMKAIRAAEEKARQQAKEQAEEERAAAEVDVEAAADEDNDEDADDEGAAPPDEDVDDDDEVTDEVEAADDDDSRADAGNQQAIAKDEQDGQETEAEDQAQLQALLETLPPIEVPPPRLDVLVEIELLLTDAYMQLARHRASGVVDPQELNIGWHITRRNVLAEDDLYAAVSQNRVRAYLQSLKPSAPEYLALETALQRYLALHERGGWRAIEEGGGLLKEDDDDDRVPAIRARLLLTGDLGGPEPQAAAGSGADEDDEYDAALVRAVRNFQARHGLKVDGIVGPQTLHMLNMSAADKLQALRANMERWRWLPPELGQRHIRVNVPAYDMQVIENGKPVLQMPTIVGMPDRRTPNFSETMKYLVANPTWEVPPSIAKKDKLPILKENLAYLEEHKFDVLSGWGEDETVVDARTLDWSEFNEEYFPYHLRQQPGPTNALGRVKFMLPNRFNIYLHDTPAKHLFDASTRTFSSGCVRLERPLELADYILGNDPRWQGQDIRKILEGEPKQILRLKNHIPVHFLYFTAWVDQQGIVQFREDVYNRDAGVINALNQKTVVSQ